MQKLDVFECGGNFEDPGQEDKTNLEENDEGMRTSQQASKI